MENTTADPVRYPIGPFKKGEQYSPEEINSMITSIEEAPDRIRSLVEKLTPEDLEKTYRTGSWNVRQLVHHLADIQLLHLLRMKKALTEPDYREVTLIDMAGWAATPDGADEAGADSLLMLDGSTRRYGVLLRSMEQKE